MNSKSIFQLLSIVFVSATFGCNSDNKSDERSDSASIVATDTTLVPSVPVAEKVTECYSYIKNRDTANLSIQTELEELTGTLNYQLFEKDKNKGTIAGELKGDTVIAEYTFNSEGVSSVREVVFLRRDGKLYEGYGEVESRGAKTVFKDRSKLNFGDGIVFTKTSCN